ncbi:NAD(P)-dependent oxidoreductase [Streptomyces sp. NPDC056716]|uniref:NAD(P)-dependent oxidoreductase n=1 Tax=unclassified Streptomyces TaxID=2593676 RepID=UPI003679CB7B
MNEQTDVQGRELGFIGLGRLGAPIAGNLRADGHRVTGFDRFPQAVADAARRGVDAADSAAGVGRVSGVVFTCVRTAEDLTEALSGPDGLLAGLPKGSVVLDLSTVSPTASAGHAQLVEEAGCAFLRVAVSGSAPAAESRQISFLCSGPRTAYERVAPLLESVGRGHVYLGPADEARSVKIAINMLVGVGMAALVEAVALAERLGIDRGRFLHAVERSAVGSPFVTAKATALAERDYSPTASLALMLKDLDLALAAGESVDQSLPVTELARQMYAECRERGWDERDFACVAELYEREGGPA